MRIQIISDLHLEFDNNFNISKNADYIALCGDIGYPGDNSFKKIIKMCSKKFKKVFLISGNHEYYNSDILSTHKKIEKVTSSYDNVFFLNNTIYNISNDCIILGTTLWSYIEDDYKYLIETSINDYKLIKKDNRKLTVDDTNKLFLENKKWIEDVLKENKHKKIIVLTHHAPSYKAIPDKYKGHFINQGFVNDLDYLLKDNSNIKYWFFGHTHTSFNFKINQTLCVCNPRGYVRNGTIENLSFQKEISYEI